MISVSADERNSLSFRFNFINFGHSRAAWHPWALISNNLYHIALNNFEILKSHPVGSNGQNYILAHTPLKFLPVVEFEKRQKSIHSKQSTQKELMAPPTASKPATKPRRKNKKNKKRNK